MWLCALTWIWIALTVCFSMTLYKLRLWKLPVFNLIVKYEVSFFWNSSGGHLDMHFIFHAQHMIDEWFRSWCAITNLLSSITSGSYWKQNIFCIFLSLTIFSKSTKILWWRTTFWEAGCPGFLLVMSVFIFSSRFALGQIHSTYNHPSCGERGIGRRKSFIFISPRQSMYLEIGCTVEAGGLSISVVWGLDMLWTKLSTDIDSKIGNQWQSSAEGELLQGPSVPEKVLITVICLIYLLEM